jgi:Aminotransferase class-V
MPANGQSRPRRREAHTHFLSMPVARVCLPVVNETMNDNNMKTASTSTKYSKQQNEDVDCGTTFVETEHYQHDDEIVKAKNDLLGGASLTIDSLRDALASDVIVDCKDNGPYTMITSPFERSRSATTSNNKYYTVPIIYCDQTASNRPLRSIEQYIERNCLPYYGNTHTNTSITGSQSTAYVGEARQIVAEVTNAKITGKASCDIVLFTGHGTTSVIELFIDCINIKEICRNCVINQQPRPVVFIGPYEHHSNLIPWRETGCEIVMIPEDTSTQNVDMKILEECDGEVV